MREFEGHDGDRWIATIGERPGTDFKGRHHLLFTRGDGEGKGLPIEDIRWNSPQSAERTLGTMSGVELRRLLRCALGRSHISGR